MGYFAFRTDRVPETKSFFTITRNNTLTCGQPYSVPTCDCKGESDGRRIGESVKVVCAQPPAGDVLIPVDLSRVCNKRRRRSVEGVDQYAYDDSISIDDFNDILLSAPIPTYPTTTSRPSTPIPRAPEEEHHQMHNYIVATVDDTSLGNGMRVLSVPRSHILSRPGMRVPSVSRSLLSVSHSLLSVPRSHIPDGSESSTTINEEQARARCRSSLASSLIYNLCNSRVDSTVITSTCVLDVKVRE